MPTIRTLRRDHGMSFTEFAFATGVPARTLAQLEYGLRTLDTPSRQQIAATFGIPPESLRAAPASPRYSNPMLAASRAAAAACLLAALFVVTWHAAHAGETSVPESRLLPTVAPTVAQVAFAATLPTAFPTEAPSETPSETPTEAPTALPAPRFWLAEDGPHGCPLAPPPGLQVLLTQGYAEGSHLPASTMGALDMIIGDTAQQEVLEATLDAPIQATLGGTAQVFPNSWPGGNFIIITNPESGYATAYGHLSSITISDGQQIEAGQQIGTLGNTGMSSGPHLHYEVRAPNNAGNIDPMPLVGCW